MSTVACGGLGVEEGNQRETRNKVKGSAYDKAQLCSVGVGCVGFMSEREPARDKSERWGRESAGERQEGESRDARRPTDCQTHTRFRKGTKTSVEREAMERWTGGEHIEPLPRLAPLDQSVRPGQPTDTKKVLSPAVPAWLPVGARARA